METIVRWNIRVSRQTDLELRALLRAKGIKRGGRSKFVEDAVRRLALRQTIEEIQANNAVADPEEIQAIVDQAVSEVRAQRRAKQRG